MAKLRKMLGQVDSPYIVSLMRLIETQSKATIASWCLDYTESYILPIFKRHLCCMQFNYGLQGILIIS